jgi:hypothetical protein
MTTKQVIQHVCSLGTHCQSSQICKDAGLKYESYPFDWIFSSPNMIQEILHDDFRSFLNKELYIPHGSNKCGHTLYGLHMFNHHNPKTNSNHYSYFTRCVERFRTLLSSNSHTLFLIIYVNMTRDAFDEIKQQVIDFNEYLSTRTQNHSICVVFHIPKHAIFTCTTEVYTNITFLIVYTRSMSGGSSFHDAQDNTRLRECIRNLYDFQVTKLVP